MPFGRLWGRLLVELSQMWADIAASLHRMPGHLPGGLAPAVAWLKTGNHGTWLLLGVEALLLLAIGWRIARRLGAERRSRKALASGRERLERRARRQGEPPAN